MKSSLMKKLVVGALGVIMAVSLAACGGSGSSSSSSSSKKDYSKITADTSKRTVTVYAKVNGTYFTQSTRHYLVFKDGSNGDKSVMTALGSEKDFYGAMIKIGGEPWDKMVPNKKGQKTGGQKVKVTVSWKGNKDVPAVKTLKTDNGQPKIDFRFSGNIKNAYKNNTGCIACLDSCSTGIVSNAAYGFGDIEGGKVKVMGNSKVLPKDGTIVKVTFALQD